MTRSVATGKASVGHFDETVKGLKTSSLIDVIRVDLKINPKKILVVGCGSGLEAGQLAREFGAETVGIDTTEDFDFNHAASAPARLLQMDALDLHFEDESFDFIFSFHALEHIPGPTRALSEMSRVLRKGGTYLIGTPNRSRLIGYIGSARPLHQKIKFNIADLRMRLRGKWSNEQGAHAGFSVDELSGLCRNAFGSVLDVSSNYYLRAYRSKRKLVELLIRTRLNAVAYPCVYVAGCKDA